jgi:hypothetical protein
VTNLLDRFADSLAGQVAGLLPEEARQRLAALHAARSAMPTADVYERILLSRYILTGSQDEPEVPESPFPFRSGNQLVLGPEIFASTEAPYDEGVVLCWRGRNFVPQLDDNDDEPEPTRHIDIDPQAPAPMSGAHWRGHRGQ